MSASGAYQARALGDNVIPLNARPFRQSRVRRLADHATLFATNRRAEEDVFWLKENAEFLNIVQATNQPARATLSVYESIYEEIDRKLGHYPQYYRFLLSICLDLEDIGMQGNKGIALCDWVLRQGLPGAEMSDLQRAEAHRLISRRHDLVMDPSLLDRLHDFMSRTATFRIPNKKAAYELTHIVFYLSEYGDRDPQLSGEAIASLQMAGLLAFLDQNFDLLAEVCIALRYANVLPSPIWERAVARNLRKATTIDAPIGMIVDDYHCYAVSSWLAAQTGGFAFPLCYLEEPVQISLPRPQTRPISALTQLLEDTRCPDWEQVREPFLNCLDEDTRTLLRSAEDSVPDFGDFFEGFARASTPIGSDRK